MLQALCCVPNDVGDEAQISAIALAFLVVSNTEDTQLASSLLESKFATYNKLLCHVAKSKIFLLFFSSWPNIINFIVRIEGKSP